MMSAEIRDRREHRRARAEHDARLARHALAPGGEAFGVGERGMQHRHRNGETLAETPDELRREPDLRHQHQRALAAAQRSLDRVQIDLGLAAAGDAVQQEGREAPVRGIDGLHRHGLLLAQAPVRCRAAGRRRRLRPARPRHLRPRRRSRAPPARASACASPRTVSASASLVTPSARAQGLEQLALARRALQSQSERRESRLGREPAFGERARGGAFARELGQRRGDHLAERVVVVLRRPLEQLHHLRVDDRRRVDDLEHRLEFFRRHFRASWRANARRRPGAGGRRARARACPAPRYDGGVALLAGSRTAVAAAYRARRARSVACRQSVTSQGFPQCVWISLWMMWVETYKNACVFAVSCFPDRIVSTYERIQAKTISYENRVVRWRASLRTHDTDSPGVFVSS